MSCSVHKRLPIKTFLLLSLSFYLVSCAGTRPVDLGVAADKLSTCPTSPNCVCSDCDSKKHQIPPLVLAITPDHAWQVIREQIAALPRTLIISVDDNYLHAECRSTFFGFTDDLELHLRPESGVIAVRSAARLGYYDFGVNRKRIVTLRSTLREKGIVR